MLFDYEKDHYNIEDPIKKIKNNHFIKKVKTFLIGQSFKNIIFIQKKFLYAKLYI